VKYYDSVKPPTRYLALNPNAKFVPEWGMEHGDKARKAGKGLVVRGKRTEDRRQKTQERR
jgi:hypothetical protein